MANRVLEIRNHFAPVQWKFCKGKENSANALSRACSPSDLINNDVWSNGPFWLKESSPVLHPEKPTNQSDEESVNLIFYSEIYV